MKINQLVVTFGSDSFVASHLGLEAELSALLEHYLCEVFQLSDSKNSRYWWCDGVFSLTIICVRAGSIRFQGTAIWDERGNTANEQLLAPFQIDWPTAPKTQNPTSPIAVRFGIRTSEGRMHKVPHDRATKSDYWPGTDQNWAVGFTIDREGNVRAALPYVDRAVNTANEPPQAPRF